uniref:ATP synthase complex subunit 8 n=1 Tax=Myllocerinus aurolineatus TaxID=2527849 RepID=A0A411LW40_9CUCU|nr:ATP synthase F0 subunit 8 [Myllocerinus aurolineatus]QBF03604.1 ATP synthase F0 subunit 8 [Myllocerinus aurolineatus]
MPQMAPINWLTLYFIFLSVFLMFIILNYYSFLYFPKTIKTPAKKLILSWKW